MSSEPQPYDPLGAGDRGGRPRRRVSRLAVGAGLTLFLGLAGAGLAFAVDSGSGASPAASLSASSTTSSIVPAPHAHGGWGLRPFGPGLGGHRGLGGDVVHGQFTVRDGNGYQTVEVQIGNVTSVSATSITVASPDGYTATYKVVGSTVVDSQSVGIGAVTKGDQVRLLAVVQGSRHTAAHILDMTKLGDSGNHFGMDPRWPIWAPHRMWGQPTGGTAAA